MLYKEGETIEEHNKNLFNVFRKLNLPLGKYAIVSGGPLAVRGIKKTGDVDVLVTDDLWQKLKEKYPVKVFEEVRTEIISLNEDVDVLSFRKDEAERLEGSPTNDDQIKNAEIIDGLSFQSLRDSLWFKVHSDREKDKKDIKLVKEYLKTHTKELAKIDFKI